MRQSLSMMHWLGQLVIVRAADSYWLGTLEQKYGREVLLTNAACVESGIRNPGFKWYGIVEPHLSDRKLVWLHASEIIPYEAPEAENAPCTDTGKGNEADIR